MNLPRVFKLHQRFAGDKILNLEEHIKHELSKPEILSLIRPGMRIAITAGSRGIANIPDILKHINDQLRTMGANPFIVPAMGSHGGATAQGQVEVLNSLGITEEYCGAPIYSSMEVIQLGTTAQGMPVYMDKLAAEADGVIIVGRIKPHTDFKADIESGLAKMAAIGLGKHKQAKFIHTFGVRGIRDVMPKIAEVIFNSGHVLFCVGIVENAYEETAIIEAIPTPRIIEREKQLLKQAKAYMPCLPVDNLDILFVDEIGKNYSGTGMDTNIIGRIRIPGVEEPEKPQIKYIIAADLSEASHGNALGIGLADLTTERLFRKINFQTMNENVITSTFLARASIPIVLPNDREAIQTALRATWGVEPQQARFMRIPNTLHLEYVYASESLLPELSQCSHIEILGEPQEMQFDDNGNLVMPY